MKLTARRSVFARTCVFLLLGAAVNVAVAWGCETRLPKSKLSVTVAKWKQHSDENWSVMTQYRCSCDIWTFDDGQSSAAFLQGRIGGKPTGSMIVGLDKMPIWSFARSPEWPTPSSVGRQAQDRAAGWPMLSLRCRYIGNMQSASVPLQGGIRLEPEPRNRVLLHRALPCIPIWPGIAINTIFYAAICWLLFAAPFAVRRRLRLRRGQCPHCAYPVGTSDLCTECGKPVAAPRPVTATTQKET